MESCDFLLWAPFRFCPALIGCLIMWVGGRFPEACYDVDPWSNVSNVQAFPSILLGTPFINVECIACHLQEKTGLRWLGTVVTSHTASNRQAYTPGMSMLQKAVQNTHRTSCNQPAHTNVIMLYAVKCSLYVVGPFLCRTLHKSC